MNEVFNHVVHLNSVSNSPTRDIELVMETYDLVHYVKNYIMHSNSATPLNVHIIFIVVVFSCLFS